MPELTRRVLTKVDVDGAKPGPSLYRLRDARVPGLLLRVTTTGKKQWALTWARGQERVFGNYPGVTLEAARVQAQRMLGEAAEHGAPLSVIDKRSVQAPALAAYLRDSYGPWVTAERRSGAATLKRLRAAFEQLLRKKIDAISIADLDRWKADRLKAGVAPQTVNRDLTALKAALGKAEEWQLLQSAPARAAKKAKVDDDRRVRFLTPEEAARLREALAARDRDMIEARKRTIAGGRYQHRDVRPIPDDGFGDLLTPLVLTALNTGCRRSELTGLKWADVELDRVPAQIIVRASTSKGAKTRDIPLSREAVDVLRRWKRQNPEGRVFPIQSPKKAWAAILERAQIVDFHFHDCRHDFASRLAMAGVPLVQIRELLGHSSIAMTERYAHLCPSGKSAAIAVLDRRSQ